MKTRYSLRLILIPLSIMILFLLLSGPVGSTAQLQQPEACRVNFNFEPGAGSVAAGSSMTINLQGSTQDLCAWLAQPSLAEAPTGVTINFAAPEMTIPPAGRQSLRATVLVADKVPTGNYQLVVMINLIRLLGERQEVATPQTVVFNLTVTGQTNRLPDIDVTPASLDFGLVAMGSINQQRLIIRNSGQADLFVNSISLAPGSDPGFNFCEQTPTGFVLPIGGTREIIVCFAPRSIGTARGTITVSSNDPDEGVINVSTSGRTYTTTIEGCLLTEEIKQGTAIGATAITPSGMEAKKNERLPLMVKASDNDQLIQKCLCPGSERPPATKEIAIVDALSYRWTLLQGKGRMLGSSGPANLYQPPDLEIGVTDTARLQVEIRDSRNNDKPAHITFILTIKREEICKYTRQVAWFATLDKSPTPITTPQFNECFPLPEEWSPTPALSGSAAGELKLAVGQRYLLRASGADFDTLKLRCASERCGAAQKDLSLIDEMVYNWSASFGSFPAGSVSQGRATSIVYQAPDNPGDGVIAIFIRDSGRQAADGLVVRTIRVKVYQVDLDIEALPDQAEECQGRIIGVNSDDDNENDLRDKDEKRVSGENNLYKLTLDKQARESSVQLSSPKGASRIRIWKEPTKEKEVTLPATFPATELPKELWLEAIAASDKSLDVELLLKDNDTDAEDLVRLTVVELMVYLGRVDETGRGAIGPKETILRRIEPKDITFSSMPRPHVTIEDVQVQNIRYNEKDGLQAYVNVRGYVVFALADIVPDNEADPKEAMIQFGYGKPAKVELQREQETSTLLRPYAARYRFFWSNSEAAIAPHHNQLFVSVTDPLSGQTGWALGRVNIEAVNYKGEPQEPLPMVNDYGHAWVNGPWAVTEMAFGGRSPNGPFHPLIIRVDGPQKAILDAGLKAEIFERKHDLMVYENWIVCGGEGGGGLVSPKNFIERDGQDGSGGKPKIFNNHGRLNWENGQTFGAGRVSKREGFVFVKLIDSLPGADRGKLAEEKLNILDTADPLFKGLVKLGGERRGRRWGGADPGATYGPPYKAGGEDDRWKKFTDWMFDKYKVGDPAAITAESLKNMAKHAPAPDFDHDGFPDEPAGIPNGATALYWDVARTDPPLFDSLGEKHLIGYYKGTGFDQTLDFASQRQDITSILHFNNGIGWYVRELDKVIKDLIKILADPLTSDDEKKTKLLDWVEKSGFLPEEQLTQLSSGRLLLGDTSTFDKAFGPKSEFHEKYKEFVDIALLTTSFSPGTADSTLDVFLAYDIASFEGFHLFGIDAFNDVIATYAGAKFATDVALTRIKPSFDSAKALREQLEDNIQYAAIVFKDHRVFGKEEATHESFFSLMLATDAAGNFTLVFEPYWQKVFADIFKKLRDQGDPRFTGKTDAELEAGAAKLVAIWRSTLGLLLDKNKDKLKKPADRKGVVDAILDHLKNVEGDNWDKKIPGLSNGTDDVHALHQMIEILILFSFR
jgi:hypothetical protein